MGGWIPTSLSARDRAYHERSRPPGSDYQDDKDWCDLAWEAREREQNARNEQRRMRITPYGVFPFRGLKSLEPPKN